MTVLAPVRGLTQSWQDCLDELVGELLVRDPDDDVLRMLVGMARRCVHGQSAAIKLRVAQPGWLRVQVADGYLADWEGQLIPLASSMSALAIARRCPQQVGEVGAGQPTLRAGRAAGIGPALLVPLGDPESPEGVLMVGRTAGGLAFTDTDLTRLAAFTGRAWAAVTAARSRSQRDGLRRLAAYDQLAALVHEVTMRDLRRLQNEVQQLHPHIAAAAWPQVVLLGKHTTEIDRRLEHAISDSDVLLGKGDTLTARVLRICDTVPRPLQLIEQVQFHGTLHRALPVSTLTRLERWLATALVIADHHGRTRMVGITVRTTAHEDQVAVTVDYVGDLPDKPADDARFVALHGVAEPLGGLHRISQTPDQRVELSWVSDPLA